MEQILITEKSADYELLDSGDRQKLERFGQVVLSRPDPQALWTRSLGETDWQKADAVYTRGAGPAGKWAIKEVSKTVFDTEDWKVILEGLTFSLKLLPSKHVGVFPEQSAHWKWLSEKIKMQIKPPRSDLGNSRSKGQTFGKISVLNLFGYTGGATLACAKAGAEVVHVDSSEWAVNQAKENAKLSELDEKPVRFIVDDVRKFVEREIKRGNKYDVILLDPPVYGKGEKKQVWKIEEDLIPLLSRLKNLLSPEPLAIIINGYSSVYSHITYAQLLRTILHDISGSITSGELAVKESSGRLLPSGIFARWEK